MEIDGGGESVEVEMKNAPEGEPKVKRKMKTPSQLEILEKTYAMDTYPSEAVRAELSIKLGLSDRQLQMWFCHRRLKDRKVKSASSSAIAGPSGGNADEIAVTPFENMLQQQHQQRVAHKVGTAVPRISKELPSMRRVYDIAKPSLAISEQRAIAFVESQLGESLREEGPILGMEFDPLPPGAFGAPIVAPGQQKPPGRSYDTQIYETPAAKPIKGASRALQEYQFLPEKPSVRNDAYGSPTDIQHARVPLYTGRSIVHGDEQLPSGYNLPGQMPSSSSLPQQGRQGHHLSPAPGEVDIAPRISPLVDVNSDAQYLVHPRTPLDNQTITPERRIILEEERLERKRKAEEARIAKEVEAHEKRIRKELEKQDILRRKREEQLRKEMERQDRERRKEEERLLREKQREEERCLREQRREMERREKFLQKEYIRAEKTRLREEMRKEKEAARLKAANDRAAARRIAKESIELIDDQRLELMELAALSKGLPSIVALDNETLLNLDLFKDKLLEFPPKSVNLKRPFGVQPWTDSEENVGNLLMVWRFLITFADVLGLWPFTLDEFNQAFHDCDPRLLGEIHIALLRSIVKDIEDVARTPPTALAANQNSAFVTGGGHPQIVEGAYAWGFDLQNWHHLLSLLTWPEVLRQFALSAGFGPKLKKRNRETSHNHDEIEDDDGADIISNLRSGVAAENAVAFMQQRGFSNSRRSRHRLTPGTVKYAAFHVLSLEGSKGLSILEVADKIQKSGLRDLTTSKTPEASISAALSRDTKLFERTAPSTYCVRSPYRKDPTDSDTILSEAREKIRVFQNGNVDEEEAEDVEKEDADRDQDSASDVDDLDDMSKLKEAFKDKDLSHFRKENCSESMENIPDALENSKSNGALGDLSTDFAGIDTNTKILDQENTLMDDCGSGEAWVQGLTEGEYADLSIEERLNALVALIGVVNEGNTVRVALEERLEAANALKKQMWAEAQLDKRRMKEEHFLKLQSSSPLNVDMKNESSSTTPAFQLDLNDGQNNPLMQEFSSVGSENLLLQQSVYAAEKSRSDLKAYISQRAEEMYVYRSLPLGQDRRHNRYWQFKTSPSHNDPGAQKIFVELCNGKWRVIDSEKGFDALLSSLDTRGLREYHLHLMLRKIESSFKRTVKRNLPCTNSGEHVCDEVKKEFLDVRPKLDCYSSMDSPKSSSESSAHVREEININERHKDFEKWMWEECFNLNKLGALKRGRLRCSRLLEICNNCHAVFSCEDNHCPYCHKTYDTSDRIFKFPEHVIQCKTNLSKEFDRVLVDSSLPPRIRLLKAQLATIEASIPSEAIESVWSDEYRKCWGMKLHKASTAEELLQSLTLLEDSIKKDYLAANYEATCEILRSVNITDTSSTHGAVSVLPWIPQTTAAVALRLMELDTSIYYTLHHKEACQKDNEALHFNKLPSRCSFPRSSMDNMQQDNCWVDLTSLKRGRGRPRGPTRTSGGKSQKRAPDSRDESCKETKKGRGGRKKGRCSVRSRQKSAKTARQNIVDKRVADDIVTLDDSLMILDETPVENEGADNVSSSERSEFEDDNGQASADEYEDDLLVEHLNDYGASRVDDENIEDGEEYVDEYFNSDYNEEGNQSRGGERVGNADNSSDRGSESSFSDSSY
ncbi:hypothetical protein RD792_007045 [Penstemon davidsonii]|uniref:Uncharacterized protein n=1 Tax=Penstemon davidsonii TaxID=160366 RepID=A0ABR0D5B7_9LAMI|nr:hypothetical protein RD792_007045 [Penstemon davidsonii]